MLLFWCSWFKYRFIKLDVVTVAKFCFHFSRVLGSVVDCVNVNPARAWRIKHVSRDAQNMCALTKVGTVLKRTTSEDSLQFPNGFSGKLLFHLTFNQNFRIFLLNGKHPHSDHYLAVCFSVVPGSNPRPRL